MAQVGISLALLIISSLIQRAMMKKPAINSDDNPGNLATRGTYTNIVFGRRMVDPTFSWIQPNGSAVVPTDLDSLPTSGKGTGHSGGGGNFEEAGVHFLCLGPVAKLHKIIQNGKTIWTGPITPFTHPSGTLLDIGAEGKLEVYWGESDQPISPILQNATNFGLATRMPLGCFVLWNKKNLGQSPLWPRLQYDVEAYPLPTRLTSSPIIPVILDDLLPLWNDPQLPPNQHLSRWGTWDPRLSADRVQLKILDSVAINPHLYNSDLRLKISPDTKPWNNVTGPTGRNMTPLFSSNVVKIIGTGTDESGHNTLAAFRNPTLTYPTPGAALYFYLKEITYDPFEVVSDPRSAIRNWRGITTLRLGSICPLAVLHERVGIPSDFQVAAVGDVQPGINPAHIIDQLLFARTPYGRGQDSEEYDIGTLEDLAQLCLTEALRANILVKEGEETESLLGQIMQDVGMFLPWDIQRGKYVFLPIRTPAADLPEFEQIHIAPPEPEEESPDEEMVIDRPSFNFEDREHNYRQFPIMIGDDGHGTINDDVNSDEGQIRIATSFDVAEPIAKRRSQEALALPNRVKPICPRAAALLRPGDRFRLAGFTIPLIATEVTPGVQTQETQIDSLFDTYGVTKFGDGGGTLSGPQSGGGLNPVPPADPDLAFEPFEVPASIGDAQKKILIPRIRAGADVLGAIIHLSRNNSTYKPLIQTRKLWAGGVLQVDFPMTDDVVEDPTADDPIFLPMGPDIGILEDLTGNEEAWLAGRQVGICNGELFFIRNIEPWDDGTYRIRGYARARRTTLKLAHSAGSVFYITTYPNLELLTDILIVPEALLYIKTQPFTRNKTTSLATEQVKTLLLTP